MRGSWWVVLMVSSVSHTVLPQRWPASSRVAWSSSSSRYTGFGERPSKMTMSQPANFSSAPKKPPELEQAMAPVRGPLVITE